MGASPLPTNVHWASFTTNVPTSRNVVTGGVFGSQCIEIVTSGTLNNEGQGTKGIGTPVLGTPHSGSIYLKGAVGGEKLQLVMESSVGGKETSTSISVVLTTAWQRFVVPAITPVEIDRQITNGTIPWN